MTPSLREIQNEAIGRAEAGADAIWKEAALRTVLKVASAHEHFTSDDVWESGLPSTRDNRALGAVFRKVGRAGMITKTNRVQTSRLHSRNHGRDVAVWQSFLYGASLLKMQSVHLFFGLLYDETRSELPFDRE